MARSCTTICLITGSCRAGSSSRTTACCSSAYITLSSIAGVGLFVPGLAGHGLETLLVRRATGTPDRLGQPGRRAFAQLGLQRFDQFGDALGLADLDRLYT